MNIDRKNEGNVTILTLHGELDTNNLDEGKGEIDAVLAAGASRVCVNFDDVRFINSSWIGYFVALQRRVEQDGGQVVLSQPSSFLQTTIKTLGLDRVFMVFSSDEEAVKHFGGEEADTLEVDAAIDPSITGSTEMKFRFADTEGPEADARILHIWKDGISFRYPDDPDRVKIDPDDLEYGKQIAVRFSQPFIDKDHVFELEGKIAYAFDQDDGSIKFNMQYTKVNEADLKMIEDFVQTKDLVLPYMPAQDS
jgi:anti-sigma B factor antagonist